jgi:hypothetical protein
MNLSQEQTNNLITWYMARFDIKKQENYDFDEKLKPNAKITYWWHNLVIAEDDLSEGATTVYKVLQIALQEEIAKQGWYLTLRTPGFHALCRIRKYSDSVEGHSEIISEACADTILQAMMLAFKDAWEVTHGN